VAPVRFTDTLSRKLVTFVPLREGHVGFYSCGPTVYHYAHIGNLRTYIFNDVLKRSFRYAGYIVHHVMNITDVGHLTSDSDTGEDKMEKGAARENKSVWQVAEFYTDAFTRDLQQLNILQPDVWCRATDHIREQIEQIQQIERAGFTYSIADGVYFDTSKLSDYGKLARLNIDELKAGARVEMVAGKRHVTDFALWKFSHPGERRQMEWDSPWGRGFPGWHIECSAMACKYLGDEFDIHTGGIDHIPVHHTNEIAQAHAAGKPFAHYWLHGEFLVLRDQEKMAKSGDNFLTVAVLQERGYDPLAYRYFCLGAQYRKPLMFSWEAMDGAQNAYKSLQEKVLAVRGASESVRRDTMASFENAFLTAITDDFNMPQALAVLWDVLADKVLTSAEKYTLALRFDSVLGLGLHRVGEEHIPQEILAMVRDREVHRKRREWSRSDQIRDSIAALGFEVRDTPEGPVVRPR
jgi:cysteinyl-tRNA synthetase